MAALEALAKSEVTLSKKTFMKKLVYRDDNHESDTTITVCNNDFILTGNIIVY